MESNSEDRDSWVVDAEKWIAQIKGVLQCKIDLTHDGEVSGVHVVAGSEREPRHIVRDVEGLLKARLGVSVFYKKIGVVQVVETELPTPAPETSATAPVPPAAVAAEELPPEVDQQPKLAPAPTMVATAPDEIDDRDAREAVVLAEEFAPRLLCNGVGVMSQGGHLRVEVDLQAAGFEAAGVAEGSNRHGGDLHLVAVATLDAIESLVSEPLGLELVDLRRDRLGTTDVVIVAVEMVQGRRTEQLIGVCRPGVNLYEAVVYAVLDALNRRLEMMLFMSVDEADA